MKAKEQEFEVARDQLLVELVSLSKKIRNSNIKAKPIIDLWGISEELNPIRVLENKLYLLDYCMNVLKGVNISDLDESILQEDKLL